MSSDSLEEFVELTDLVLDDLGVVYYNVQWISHFVGDRRVDESYQLLLSFQGILGEDLVGLVHKADDERWVDLVDFIVNWNLLKLELLECWQEGFINEVDILQAFDDGLKHFIHFRTFEVSFEAEYLVLKLAWGHDHNFSQRELRLVLQGMGDIR